MLFLTCGCGGSSPGSTVALSSGLWSIDAQSSGGPPVFSVGGALNVTGSDVSGIMHVTYPSCFPQGIDVPVTGTLTNAIDLNLSFPSQQSASFSGLTHLGGHPGLLGGNYKVTAGGCIPASQGLASGNSVMVTGEWNGTLVSPPSATTTISMSLTQTGPDAHGFFSATGTAKLTGGTCFSDATIDAAKTRILGRGSTVTLVSTSPIGGTTVITGEFTAGGPLFPDFSGTYTSNLGTCSDTGTVSMGT